MTDQTTLQPVGSGARIQTLDVLRGVAVLGILAVNAAAFALPIDAALAPEQSPFPLIGASAVAHWTTEVFFHQKFVTLFSMLFGASIFLVGGERGDAARGRLLRRRLFWLALFGLIHGAAFWYGDILLLYAWAGLFVMLMRSMSARSLILFGAAATLALATLQAATMWMTVNGPALLVDALSDESMSLAEDAVAASIAAYRSGWPAGLIENLKAWGVLQSASLFGYVFATVPLMMLGLGLFKIGFFHGRLSTRVYLVLVAVGGAVLALLGVLEWREIMAGPGVQATNGWSEVVASYPIFITLAYASGLILLTSRGVGWVRRLFAPVGQMAFTNYLTQTLIMTSLFYMPWGPRLMGQVDYPGQWAIVVAVWALQLIWSPLWLSRFRMGPLEWLWRRLSYGHALPLRRQV
ncbi:MULTISPECIES: DUF418 domain-containing protein [unclassified Brevundimonas]|uniref:DUF418 domain-containing protein n=1 Tax=unclassified Brevundimonas TaxID=2622653 RepID=UPI000CFD4C49|nr:MULTISPECIES: DUF418 domain-containing protein [unclassified Brevundimonas]PRA36643.1 hypothetical protein CQ024_00595 [Brevundimonas sp. MYb27]PQZ74765.1 hypothetical protein CQ026_15370 [Brevundimonas sp. MYb31]PRB12982.1 hypothetical protein CQ039_13610 [Brevundimonas sp. MYb52]PRB33660.1 hypothetical protein CQ035_12910 [Brevundimonas sp. MYb46]PRB48891.1 hypothetical protein CQ028_08890 [Brevundimonas sp. MYb33]